MDDGRAMRIAIMLWGGEEPSLFREALRHFALEEGCALFSDSPRESADELHYLRFAEEDRAEPFGLTFHNVDDSPRFATAFPYVVRRPGVLFLGDIFLHRFARAVSHSALDGWGYRWIIGVACPSQADSLARLAQDGIEPGALVRTVPLARALAVRSAAVVVTDFDSARRLGGGSEMPPVSVIPPPMENWNMSGLDAFSATLNRVIPHWLARVAVARRTIPPLEHPNIDLPAVERSRLLERFSKDELPLVNLLLGRLNELFAQD
jgi:hypothetical protein